MSAEGIWKEGESAAEQEPDHLTPIETCRVNKYGTTKYQEKYCLLAYKCLSGSSSAKTKAHVCALLQCSKPTLLAWMKKYPDFKAAIEDGLELGQVKWRNKIARHAWKPSGKVNNGLIKLLSANVYGIKDDSDVVVINNTIETDPEKMMKNRGIPIPKVDIEDIDENS